MQQDAINCEMNLETATTTTSGESLNFMQMLYASPVTHWSENQSVGLPWQTEAQVLVSHLSFDCDNQFFLYFKHFYVVELE